MEKIFFGGNDMRTEISARACKKDALRLLESRGLCLPIFLFFALLFCAFLGIFYGASALAFGIVRPFASDFLASSPLIFGIGTALFLSIFLLAPFWFGLQNIIFHGLLCGRFELGSLFYYFSHKKRYFFAIRHSIRAFARLALCVALLLTVSALGNTVGNHLLEAGQNALALLVFLLSAVFLCLVIFFFSLWRADAFLVNVAFLSAPLLSYRQLHLLSACKMKQGRHALRRLNFSFCPLWLLSVLLAGFPFLFTVPYYITARAQLSFYLIND
jgi:hypothetical protein